MLIRQKKFFSFFFNSKDKLNKIWLSIHLGKMVSVGNINFMYRLAQVDFVLDSKKW